MWCAVQCFCVSYLHGVSAPDKSNFLKSRLNSDDSFGNRVYEIPGKLFQVPTAYVWIFTARLVTGQGLPYMAKEWATGAGLLFAVTTLARTLSAGKRWRSLIPGGIAVAVGEYLSILMRCDVRENLF